MNEEQKPKGTAIISARTEVQTRERIDEESQLRGHTRSQALEQIIKLGLPHYLRRFPKKYERIDNAA